MTVMRYAAPLIASLLSASAFADSSIHESPHAAQIGLAATASRLIAAAIPLEYEKQKDWGATTELAIGLRTDGKGWHTRVKRRKRSVNHGVWKHYKLRLANPEQDLVVKFAELRPAGAARIAFTAHVDAKVDFWTRAKIYQYGVHILALEMEGDFRLLTTISGEMSIQLVADDAGPAIKIAPIINQARLHFQDFRLRRISNAHGPVVRELGDGIRSIVEDELNGAELVAKLNHAIGKNRERLTFRPAEFVDSQWNFFYGSAASATSPEDAENGFELQ